MVTEKNIQIKFYEIGTNLNSVEIPIVKRSKKIYQNEIKPLFANMKENDIIIPILHSKGGIDFLNVMWYYYHDSQKNKKYE